VSPLFLSIAASYNGIFFDALLGRKEVENRLRALGSPDADDTRP
jgi:hypothetical protein